LKCFLSFDFEVFCHNCCEFVSRLVDKASDFNRRDLRDW